MTTPSEDHSPEIAAHPFLGIIESEAEALASKAGAEVPRFVREAEAAGGALLGPLASQALVLGVAALAIGGAVWWALRPVAPVQETVKPSPQVRQVDGSLIAATAPASSPPPATHILPNGVVRERAGHIVARPSPGASSVQIDTDLVRLPDGQRKLIVSSPDGTIDTAVDIPIEPALVPPPAKPWAAGLSYDTRRAVGIWVDRDVGRLVVGAAVRYLPDGHLEGEVRAGIRF